MNLDDQLRAAHQRRLDATRDRLADSEFHPNQSPHQSPVQSGPKLSTRVLAVAAGLLVLAGAGWAIAGSLGTETPSKQIDAASGGLVVDGDGDPTIDGDAPTEGVVEQAPSSTASQDDEESKTVVVEGEDEKSPLEPENTSEGASESATISSAPQVTNSGSGNTAGDSSSSQPATSTESPSTSAPVSSSGSSSSPGSSSGSSTSTVAPSTTATDPVTTSSKPDTDPEVDAGVAVNPLICASGRRAELERASLAYVGNSDGWKRLFSLVDEQDGPYYYGVWEPNYPDSVTVKVTLNAPVLASEIKVVQDPNEQVSGLIALGFPGGSANLELGGVKGAWKVHKFAEPVVLESFTINRNDIQSNIAEVFVCLADD